MSIAFQRSSENSGAVPRGGPGTDSSFNLDRHDRGIGRPGFTGQSMGCFRGAGAPSELGRRKFGDDRSEESDSSNSSIGRNSDEEVSSAGRSSEGGAAAAGECEEVQSTFKRGALDSLESLEEVLPMKRSLSEFYCGKSKSFTSLSDAATCSSVNEIVKPENAFTRKRKNLLAYSNLWDNKNRNTIRRNNLGGISKRSAGSKSTLALAASMGGCAESANNSDSSNSNSSSPGSCLPPLPPQRRQSHENASSASPPEQSSGPWRSYSLSDLQGAAISGSALNNRRS